MIDQEKLQAARVQLDKIAQTLEQLAQAFDHQIDAAKHVITSTSATEES